MKGKLYGVGVGPGDPELLTLKAVRLIREADVIAVPGKDVNALPLESVAYKIALSACPEISGKCAITVLMPMTKEKSELEAAHLNGAITIADFLENGKNVVFLTLGDPTVYSTYIYVHKKVIEMGYEAEIINGIPSFCAVAARLNTGLAEQSDQIHIIPASYSPEDALRFPGTKVFMKAGKNIKKVRDILLSANADCVMIENCGMEDEKIYMTAKEIPDTAGYYSLMIVKGE